jgi:hypothetical protein
MSVMCWRDRRPDSASLAEKQELQGHEGHEEHEGLLLRKGTLDPDNTNKLMVAPLPDALRIPSRLRASVSFVSF